MRPQAANRAFLPTLASTLRRCHGLLRPVRGWRQSLGLPGRGSFLGARSGGVAVESAIAISALVMLFGGLMAVAHAAYSDDRMNRAARAAARAVALEADLATTQTQLTSIACAAARAELDLADEFDCEEKWTVKVKIDLAPSSLSSGKNPDGISGDMVLVTIGWEQADWALQAVSAIDGNPVATGVALREPAEPGADS